MILLRKLISSDEIIGLHIITYIAMEVFGL